MPFAEADLAPHALPFVDMHDFGDQLVEAGFSTPVLDMETITVTYDTPQALLADVRAGRQSAHDVASQHDGQAGLAAHAGRARAWSSFRWETRPEL
jgi:malonyl-CoA O-methyltransferase